MHLEYNFEMAKFCVHTGGKHQSASQKAAECIKPHIVGIPIIMYYIDCHGQEWDANPQNHTCDDELIYS